MGGNGVISPYLVIIVIATVVVGIKLIVGGTAAAAGTGPVLTSGNRECCACDRFRPVTAPQPCTTCCSRWENSQRMFLSRQ